MSLCQGFAAWVETDTASMVLNTAKAHRWCNLQQIHLLHACISLLADEMNHFRWVIVYGRTGSPDRFGLKGSLKVVQSNANPAVSIVPGSVPKQKLINSN